MRRICACGLFLTLNCQVDSQTSSPGRNTTSLTRSASTGNRTSDDELVRVATREQRVIVTKDRDFEVSHLLRGEPSKLLLITTGNIANRDLAALLARSLDTIIDALATTDYVELTADALVIRRGS